MNSPETKILETNHWLVFLMEDQKYLGRCVVVLKRPCGDLALLNQEESLDFFAVVRLLENAARKSFDATMFNWTCLMNDAYQEKIPKPQVHWHFRPRYNHAVEFSGIVFEDPNFGHHYLRSPDDKGVHDEDTLKEIATRLRNGLSFGSNAIPNPQSPSES